MSENDTGLLMIGGPSMSTAYYIEGVEVSAEAYAKHVTAALSTEREARLEDAATLSAASAITAELVARAETAERRVAEAEMEYQRQNEALEAALSTERAARERVEALLQRVNGYISARAAPTRVQRKLRDEIRAALATTPVPEDSDR